MSYLNHNNLFVSGAGTVGGLLNVSTLEIKNNGTVSGTFVITGNSTFSNNLTVSSLNITGNIAGLQTHFPAGDGINYISGPTILRAGNFTISSSLSITGSLIVTGASTFGGVTAYSSSLIPFDNAQLLAYQAHTTTSTLSVIRQQKNSSSGIQDYYWELTDLGNLQLVQAARNGAYNYSARMFFNNSGIVGIATNTPTQAIFVINSFLSTTIGSSGFLNSAGTTGTASGGVGLSLWASGDIAATTLRAFSDQRIKKNIIQLNDATCLTQLRQLQPTQYQYVDSVQRGSATIIGFIAQDVKNVIPYAVNTITDYIPSIYTTATVSNTTLTFDSSIEVLNNSLTKLKLYDIDNKEILTSVTSILSDSQLIISDILATNRLLDGKIFVYGHEVSDFHQLDKNAVFSVAVGALQELDRKNTELQSTVTTLQTELSDLKALLISKNII
jgi:hypothetical protein